ncbi:MAG: sigma-70 family RNA polymerase sigma factor [Oscillospiraceae bacterium]|nr:sigma-70 family RNA polymerase sigma factor [Oscillospiraceae bacterium]
MFDEENPDEKALAACTDLQLAQMIKSGSSRAFVELTARYVDLVQAKSAPFHGTFLDRDDFYQEGLWGLYTAACTFDPNRGAKFATYAGTCIHNRMVMVYRSAKSGRSQPPNGFVPLSDAELSATDAADPEARVLAKERLQKVRFAIQNILTPMEQHTLQLYLSGCTYAEIAQKMQISVKAADNAMQRVRQKLRKHC